MSMSAGAVNDPQVLEVSKSMSATPSRLSKAFFTEDAQPPQVMPGSFNETV